MKEREELKQELKLEIKAEQVGRPTTRTLRILHTFRALRSLCTLHLSSAPSTRNLCLLNPCTTPVSSAGWVVVQSCLNHGRLWVTGAVVFPALLAHLPRGRRHGEGGGGTCWEGRGSRVELIGSR